MAISKYGSAIYGINLYYGYPTVEFEYKKDKKKVTFVMRCDTTFDRALTKKIFVRKLTDA